MVWNETKVLNTWFELLYKAFLKSKKRSVVYLLHILHDFEEKYF